MPSDRQANRKAAKALIGTTISGRYQLVRLLGEGGMGSVYKAADTVLRRFVAVKLLHPSTAKNPSAVERFVREARSSAAIGHPNIIDVLDFGYEGKRPFLVMEYLRGRSLSEVIRSEGRLSVARACNIATHSLAGLGAAHDRGILHRDLKPANLMLIALLGDRDFVKICDFGFAALVIPSVRIDGGNKALTPARTLVGTPAYAAPERLRGDDRRDPRLDVWSIGVVLYEMLAGRRPFDASTFRELTRKVRKEPAPPLHRVHNDIPRGLDAVVQKALAKKREKRFSNAAEFAAALVPFGGRVLPNFESEVSDSFTMDLLRLRARETQQRTAIDARTGQPVSTVPPRPGQHGRAQAMRKNHARPGMVAEPTSVQSPRARMQSRLGEAARHADDHRAAPLPMAAAFPVHDGGGVQAAVAIRAPEIPGTEALQPDYPAHDGGGLATELNPSLANQFPPERTIQTEERAVRGALPLAVLRFVSRRFGERALQQLLGGLHGRTADVFGQGVDVSSWVGYEEHNSLIAQVDAKLGRDDLHLAVQCGRAAAESTFERMRQIRYPSPPPQELMTNLPLVLEDFYRGTVFTVTRVGRGFARIELDEGSASSLIACVFLIGLFDRSLDRFGAKEVEVNLSSTPALGDNDCIYDITWLASR